KILTEQGTAYRKVIAVNGSIQVRNVTGSVTFPDGHSAKIREDDIAELPLFESPEMMTDYKALVVLPPELKRGCTVHIEYDRTITNLLYLEPWTYATSVPVRKAACSLSYPIHIPVKYRTDDASVKVQKNTLADATTVVFETADQKEVSVVGRSQDQENAEKKIVFQPEHLMTERWSLSTNSWQ